MHALRERWRPQPCTASVATRRKFPSLLIASSTSILPNCSFAQCGTQMAEPFGTAVGAIQLTTTLHLLIRICKDAKVARQTIKDARGVLTRLEKQVDQLLPHANHDNDASRLLAINILNCEKRAGRVRELLESMERRMERAPSMGRLYTAIMGTELKRLLDEMEHAKGDMHDAFRIYCYNRKASVRTRGSLSRWSLKLRRRKQISRNGHVSRYVYQ